MVVFDSFTVLTRFTAASDVLTARFFSALSLFVVVVVVVVVVVARPSSSSTEIFEPPPACAFVATVRLSSLVCRDSRRRAAPSAFHFALAWRFFAASALAAFRRAFRSSFGSVRFLVGTPSVPPSSKPSSWRNSTPGSVGPSCLRPDLPRRLGIARAAMCVVWLVRSSLLQAATFN